MTLVLDRRQQVGDQAGVHALIIGVDHYPGLVSSTASVRSAQAVASWLTDDARLSLPIVTVRTLLSPAPEEEIDVDRASTENILRAVHEWREDANVRRENAALFYWSGHGLQVTPLELALLSDGFGETGARPFYDDAISLDSIYYGMAPTARGMAAATQLYLIDADRTILPERRRVLGNARHAFDVPMDIVDDRTAPMFFAAVPGGHSYAKSGELTLFTDALLRCVAGEAAERTEDYVDGRIRWRVSVNSLDRGLHRCLNESRDTLGINVRHSLGGLVRDATICFVDKPPATRSLVRDRRVSSPAGSVHSLVVGVSRYPYLDPASEAGARRALALPSLSAPTRSAVRVHEWMVANERRLPGPLATARLLLSPSPSELAAEPRLSGLGDRATMHNFLAAISEWRADLASDERALAVFYFAGHGAKRQSRDVVLPLEDVGEPNGGLLRNAVELDAVIDGMAPLPSQPRIARRQLYLIDVCRIEPVEFRKFEWMHTTPVFDVERGGVDDRKAPVFFAATPGAAAYAVKNGETLFSRALLDTLQDSGTEPVTVFSLWHRLTARLSTVSERHGVDQELTAGGQFADFAVTQC